MTWVTRILAAVARWFRGRRAAEQQLQLVAREYGQAQSAHHAQIEAARSAVLALEQRLKSRLVLSADEMRALDRVFEMLARRKR